MRIGLQIPNFTWPGGAQQLASRLRDIVQTADEGGFYSVWVMDHFFQISMVGPAESEMLESYSTLSYLAGITHRVKLGAMVTGVIYRNPGVLAKTVTTLDVLSNGRAYLGIGAGWYQREAEGLGIPFPVTKERFERLEETLQIVKQMWSTNDGPYHGQHYQLAETLCVPQPLSQPHPNILIGGMGEQKTLRLVAQYANACNLFSGAGVETIRAKLDTLRQHCDSLKRDYNTIERTCLDTIHLAPGHATAAEVIAYCRQFKELGIEHMIFNMPNVQDIRPLEIFAKEIIPALAN
ncbi:MAG: LLM class F420-dependent oxidoreductase [Anaerolineae bacterium]|nr:LLM class F420-dependent oxidoreductase [Anaerolineae bacterium]